MRNIKHLGILFLFLIVASSLFATISEKPRQGLVSIFEDLQPASEPLESVSDAGVQPLGTVTPRHANQFTGRRWDGFSQTYNHRNRQMNPKYGRFISRDPIGFRGGRNLWNYVGNNPVRHRDPSGLFVDNGTTWVWGVNPSKGKIGGMVHGKTEQLVRIRNLNTTFSAGICKIDAIDFEFSQTVYIPNVDDTLERAGVFFYSDFVVDSSFRDSVIQHESYHAMPNTMIAWKLLPKYENKLKSDKLNACDKAACDAAAKVAADKALIAFEQYRKEADIKWDDLIGRGSNPYSQDAANQFNSWFYPWLGSL